VSSVDDEFKWDVFLSHSSKDKGTVREIANRLKSDGVRVWFDEWEIRPGDSIPAKIEDGLEHSRVLVLCMSKAAFGSDWAQLESHTFRFKDPLNHNRRFIPLRLDDTPTKGSLAQFSYIDWRPTSREEYPKLLDACLNICETNKESRQEADTIQLSRTTNDYLFLDSSTRVLTASNANVLRLWDAKTGQLLGETEAGSGGNLALVANADESLYLASGLDSAVRIFKLSSGRCERTLWGHTHGKPISVLWSSDSQLAFTGSADGRIRLWDVESGKCTRTLYEGEKAVCSLAYDRTRNHLVSGSEDHLIRLWDILTGYCVKVLPGHVAPPTCLSTSPDCAFLASAGRDNTLRIWRLSDGRSYQIFEGHTEAINTIAWSPDGQFIATGANDNTVRIWSVFKDVGVVSVIEKHSHGIQTVKWVDESQVFSGDRIGTICHSKVLPPIEQSTNRSNVQYTNAKVLLVGNSAAGKTGLSNRLALDTYKETDSTVGAWATQWKLPLSEGGIAGDSNRPRDEDGLRKHFTATNVEQEVWLWDFGGQADQRLIHQLYMDQTQLAALVFDPQKDDVFETLGQWDRDLSRADKDKDEKDQMTKLLVAGRCDAGGLRVARSQVEDFAEERGYDAFVETSAKTSEGCDELKKAIIDGIKWENIPWRSSPVLFKRLKDEIIRLKDEDRVLLRFNELREVLSLRMQAEDTKFTDAELKAVVGLLAGPGVVWELEFGSWVLLQPERINAYAQAVIQTVREDEHDRGCILEQRVLNGDLTYHASIPRLPADEERFVLLAMHQILVERGLCIRHLIQPVEGTDGRIQSDKPLLIFPSYYRRERPELVGAPAIVVSYQFNGFLDEIYATLVVKLHHTTEFDHDELWRYAADFKSKNGHSLGVRLTRRAEGEGELDVYFGSEVPVGERIIFSKYVHEHLLQSANDVVRLRHYVCPHCGTPVGNRQVAMRKLEEGKKDIPCVECDDAEKRVPLWDELEELFADDEIKQRVRELNEHVRIVLDTESKERALVGEVISTVALAGQICREIQVSDWGLDAEVEFKNDDGQACAKRVWLQLKSGDSFLTIRKKDGAAIFKSFNQRQAKYWMDHAEPVMLLIRNSNGEIQWMDVRDELLRVTNNGEKQVRQIVFAGKRFDVMSVRRCREKALGSK